MNKKLYWETLPRNGKCVKWSETVGHTVHFKYKNIEDDLKIIDYLDGRVDIKYKDKIYNIGTSGFKCCEIGLFLKHVDLPKDEYDRWYSLKDKQIKTTFELSKDKKYWIGHTWENDEFWFDGDEKTIKYIKQHTWRKITDGYFQNDKEEKLHRVVMGITDKNIFINHLGGNKWDNRKHMMSISNSLDNSKEKIKGNRNTSGIVGLVKRRNKWVGSIKVNNVGVYTKYKTKDEAIIDLLIIQRHYGFRHNEDKYYLLENIPKERENEVIENIERQINKKRNDKICSKNIFELSEDGTYYNVYDVNGKSFKISLESKEKVEKGIWHVAYDISCNTTSIHGTIIINGIRKTVKLHRYLFDLLDDKYKNWFVVKNNNNELDNRLDNLVITDKIGNGLSKKIKKGYEKRFDRYRVSITLLGKHFSQTVNTEQEAIELIEQKRKEAFKNRLQFKSKDELDYYLNNISKEDKNENNKNI